MIEMGFGRLQSETALLFKIRVTSAFQRVREQIYLGLLLVDNDHLFNIMVHDHRLYLPLARLLGILAGGKDLENDECQQQDCKQPAGIKPRLAVTLFILV